MRLVSTSDLDGYRLARAKPFEDDPEAQEPEAPEGGVGAASEVRCSGPQDGASHDSVGSNGPLWHPSPKNVTYLCFLAALT